MYTWGIMFLPNLLGSIYEYFPLPNLQLRYQHTKCLWVFSAVHQHHNAQSTLHIRIVAKLSNIMHIAHLHPHSNHHSHPIETVTHFVFKHPIGLAEDHVRITIGPFGGTLPCCAPATLPTEAAHFATTISHDDILIGVSIILPRHLRCYL